MGDASQHTPLIVTARSQHLLRALLDNTERVKFHNLSTPEARLFISKHLEVALPFDDTEEPYVQQLLEYAHGHPLAFKVVTSMVIYSGNDGECSVRVAW